MSNFRAAWQLAIARTRTNWKLLSTVVLGVLAAVVLLASAPLYSGVLNDLGLRYTLRNEPPSRSDLLVQQTGQPSQRETYQAAGGAIEQQVNNLLGSYVGQPARFARTASFYIFRDGQNITPPAQTANNQTRGYLQFATGMEQHLRIVEGVWPATASGNEIPVIAGRAGAEEAQIKVGDLILAAPVTGGTPIALRVAAVAEASDPEDRFWQVDAVRMNDLARDWVIVPLAATEDQYFAATSALSSDYTWQWPTDTGRLTTGNAAAARDALTRLRASLAGAVPGATVVTALDSILGDYLGKLAITEVPLYLLILQIIGLVLFYLVLVSSVLVERQAPEIALLKSRGASAGQVLMMFLLEGLIIGTFAAVIGPPLAALLTASLGRLPGSPLAGGGALPVRLGPETWLLAVAGAPLAVAALLVPAARAARTSIVLYRRQAARASGPPFWQRYYLDVFLLIIAVLGYWSIHQQSTLGGTERIDPLLLLSPALLALAVSAAFLRLFPLTLRLLLRLVSAAAPTPALIGLWQMSRRPGPYTRLVLLLTLTTSLGLFAATFSGTISRSYQDRTAYRVGADARISGIAGDLGQPKAQIEAALKDQGTVTSAYRITGQVGPTQNGQRYTFLALDTATAPDVVWFRDDFAGRPLPELLAQLADNGAAVEGPVVPEGGEKLGLWVRPQPAQPRLTMLIRLRDADGKLLDLELGKLDFSDWRILEAPLASLGGYRAPLRLNAIYLQPAGGFAEPGGGSVLINDLAVRDSSGIRRIVSPLDTVNGWEILRDNAGDQNDQIGRFTGETASGTPAVRFAWSPRRTFGTRGIRLREESDPLPVLASPGFLAAASRNAGDTLLLAVGNRTVQAVIRGTIDYFPTLDPAGAGFVVAAVDPALARLNAVPGRPIYPNEAWLRTSADPASLNELGTRGLGARSVLSQLGLLQEASSDPLVAAGWSGILSLAFLAAVLLSLAGFLVQTYLALQRRLVEFAILRTMGLSFGQLVALIAFEQVFLILGGIAIGTVLGLQIGTLMLPLLELTERGNRILPPFIITTQWQTVLPAYGLLALFFAGAIGTIGVLVSRLPIGRALRIGE